MAFVVLLLGPIMLGIGLSLWRFESHGKPTHIRRDMNDDLIARLRALSRHEHDDLSIGDEAADEIERLRIISSMPV